MRSTKCPHCNYRQVVAPKLVGQSVRCRVGIGTFRADELPALPPEWFEILVEHRDEGHQREVYDRLTGEGLTCMYLPLLGRAVY